MYKNATNELCPVVGGWEVLNKLHIQIKDPGGSG